MRRKLQILIVVWLLGLPLMAQSVEVLFDDSTTVDTTMHVAADTIVDSVLVQVADTIPAMDTVVQAAEPTPVMNDYYNWRDVRTVRDSLKHFMRTAR